jgi:trimeric autotransporter adhesin
VCQGLLIVGGYFSSVAGGLPAHSIAAWDGTAWHTLGSGIGTGNPYDYQYVYGVACSGHGLAAGGRFELAGGAPANNIAHWDGEQWTPLGPGLGSRSDLVFALAPFEGELVAAGEFASAGGTSCAHIARWDGAAWDAMGSGLNDDGDCLLSHKGDLYVGGWFHRAGSNTSWHIARWLGVAMDDVPEPGPTSALRLALPNPYRPGCPIALSAPLGTSLFVAIYGTDGRLERVLFRGAWDGSLLAWDGRTSGAAIAETGVYCCRAQSAGVAISRRFLRIR